MAEGVADGPAEVAVAAVAETADSAATAAHHVEDAAEHASAAANNALEAGMAAALAHETVQAGVEVTAAMLTEMEARLGERFSDTQASIAGLHDRLAVLENDALEPEDEAIEPEVPEEVLAIEAETPTEPETVPHSRRRKFRRL